MIQLLAVFAGAIFGLVVSRLAYKFLLPRVLLQQRKKMPADWRMPLLGFDLDGLAKATTFMYRYQMPVVFSVIFALFAYHAASDVNGAR